jgi:hypothetical protein
VAPVEDDRTTVPSDRRRLPAVDERWERLLEPRLRNEPEAEKRLRISSDRRIRNARLPSSSSTIQCSFTDQPPLVTRVHAAAAEPRMRSALATASGFTSMETIFA